MVKVLIADDHELMRNGIKNALGKDTNIEVVCEASDGLEAISLLEVHKIEVMLLDLNMPNMDGFKVLSHIRLNNINVKVVILSMHIEERYMLESIKKGARGYMLKDVSEQEMARAVHHVLNNEYFFCKTTSQVMLNHFSKQLFKGEEEHFDRLSQLSEREKEVIKLTVKGMSSKVIGEQLFISHRTVENHRANIMKKLSLGSSLELVDYARINGIV